MGTAAIRLGSSRMSPSKQWGHRDSNTGEDYPYSTAFPYDLTQGESFQLLTPFSSSSAASAPYPSPSRAAQHTFSPPNPLISAEPNPNSVGISVISCLGIPPPSMLGMLWLWAALCW